jgi:oligopeptidase A
MENPLLDFTGLPRFSEIEPHHVEPALDALLAENRAQIKALESVSNQANWNDFAVPLGHLEERLDRLWATVSHLNAVCDSGGLRQAYEAALEKWTTYQTELSQNRDLFAGFKRIQASGELDKLDFAKQKTVSNAIRDFRLGGVELEGVPRQRFAEIATELAALSNRFEQNLLDATDGWHLDLTEEVDLEGLPESSRALARQAAKLAGIEGWRFTLQAPAFTPFMMFSCRRQLRRKMYHAYTTRASDCGPNAGQWDNSVVMDQILELRNEQAGLLGYDQYVDYALVTRMATTSSTVKNFLGDLVHRTRSYARKDLEELISFAAQEMPDTELEVWDLPYWSEQLRQSRYEFSQEEVRPFFPLPRVLEGMFEVARKLFGIVVRPATSTPQVWHPDAMFFEILDEAQNVCAQFYLDVYARANKRGGAWMADCIGRCRKPDGSLQTPVALLTCNFSPPIDDKPSLLTHEDVLTLFHEFGHGLHHMLTKVDESAVAGINGVPWDAVELPSQFLENWCWESAALDLISEHFESGERLPTKLLQKLRDARNFQSGLQMIRQLEFSIFDLRLHSDFENKGKQSIQDVLDKVRHDVAVVQPPSFNRFQHSFSHIFAGGYAAGYYSYKWAEVLSADAFGRFEEQGLFDRDSGRAFLTEILEKGGVQDPLAMFVAFRGREPSVDTLLRHLGLAG